MLKTFKCEDESLEHFLKEQAVDHQKQLLATTHLCVYENTVAGFFTICSSKLQIRELDKDKRKEFERLGKRYPSYPATLIARLAIHQDYQRKGIGTYLIKAVVGKILESNENFSGSRFVAVDSYPQAEEFYKKFGMKRIEPEKVYSPDDSIQLFVDIFEIKL